MIAQQRANILVVDDVPESLLAVRAVLEDLGQDVVTARSGPEALRCLLKDDFAVVLLDVNMPDLNGFDTAAMMRRRERTQHTPIIFMTAFGDDRHAFQGYSLGAVDFIVTPVVPEVLRAKVRVFVELFQKNEQLRRQKEQQEALADLAERRADQLRKMASELVHTEQRERARLAQILHDHLQQLLVAARMRIDRVRIQPSGVMPQDELRAVLELIDQSIAASRSLAVELSPPVLNETGLDAAMEWLARWMEQKYGLSVQVDCEDHVKPLPAETRVTLFQAVRELLFNVVKHSGASRALVQLRSGDTGWFEVQVQDQGAGFDPASAAAASGREGLGLFSIRDRLETLGGRCEIESGAGVGTTVRLFAPIKPAVGQAEVPVDSAAPLTPSSAAGDHRQAPEGACTRVLLVDDHAIVRTGLRGLLQNDASIAIVGEACNGEDAVAQAATLQPDVVIMDISMPRMNGVEATRRIKQSQPQVAVIGLSLHEDQEIIASMLRAGAGAFVTKGGPPEDLFKAITEVHTSEAEDAVPSS